MRVFVLLSLALLLLIVPTAAAQDAAEEEITIAPSIIMAQEATSGVLVDNGDETYTLTLEGVDESLPYLMDDTEAPDGGVLESAKLLDAWAAVEGLASQGAVLQTPEATVLVTLSAPVFDFISGSVSYTVTVEGVVQEEGAPEVLLPEVFEEATLYIIVSEEFWAGLAEGYEILGLRDPKECRRCDPDPDDFPGKRR